MCAAAFLTRSEVHPLCADLHTLVAHAPPRLLDCRDRGQVRARSNRRHDSSRLRLTRVRSLTQTVVVLGAFVAERSPPGPVLTLMPLAQRLLGRNLITA